MRNIIPLFSLLICLTYCDSTPVNSTKESYPKNVKPIDQDDSAMNNSIGKAKNEFYVFDSAFRYGDFDKSLFSIKVRFPTDIGGEHIWAHSITLEGDTFYGILDDNAVSTDKVKAGDKVKITKNNLSDWVYSDNGIMKGGFTVKVLRNKMTPQERAAFDSSYYLKIVD